MIRKWFIGLLIFVVTSMAAAFAWYYLYADRIQEGIEENRSGTNSIGFAEFDIPHADSLIVGRWQNTDNPKWYKVYYDDCDDDYRLFWGKEWDESDDVLESDLHFHGNGWFRWDKEEMVLHEYATMDSRDVPIHHSFVILVSSPDSLVYYDNSYRQIVYSFVKVHTDK